jgi:hypothetical protein
LAGGLQNPVMRVPRLSSNDSSPRTTADIGEEGDTAMIAITEFSPNAQRTVCMLVAAVIVMANIGFSAIVAEAAQPHYSVTITQL